MEYVSRFFTPPQSSFFIFGPRGTGKSLWTSRTYPEALRIDLLEPDVFRAYAAKPERLREAVEANPRCRHVVIDEVQKAPSLLNVVHGLLERPGSAQFILTGSSARKLKQTGVDLMAGRAVVRFLHPYMAAELGSRFELRQALRHGLLPLVLGAADPGDVLKSYAALYVREEVQLEGLIRNVGAFHRFLEAVSFSHAAPINVANVARECQVERSTVDNYLAILEDLLLAFRVPVFARRARRAVTTHSKFFLFDAGVFRSLRPAGPLDRPQEIEGAALEGLIAQHLRAWAAYSTGDNQLFYWRTRAGNEVDLVLYGSAGIRAFEVKNAREIQPRDLNGLRAFKEDYPEADCTLLYRGAERLRIAGIDCRPVEEFLAALRPGELPE
jgi:predicted AAA+ superfamily ATPase